MDTELREQLRDSPNDLSDREHPTDDAGGSEENVARWNIHIPREHCRSFVCGSQSLGSGTSVRIPAIDENGPSYPASQMQPIHDDWCRDHLIFREDSGDGTTLFRDDEREIEQARLFDAAVNAGCAEALGCGDPATRR